ncbi:hypothetical protein [Microbulbifer spongiae]|uniref:Uncharacterized protein n=1 Tax=Microbulbifer spongiae TaxID=2944933 RepID=A0ABY9EEX8_9GAMM|nr:hypothetical protein [Microbulbifer sp. MI-G]WKD50722.1 hypothetical protein M8T91_04645 [Microbulbifer sp. MI-G]
MALCSDAAGVTPVGGSTVGFGAAVSLPACLGRGAVTPLIPRMPLSGQGFFLRLVWYLCCKGGELGKRDGWGGRIRTYA